MMDAVQKLATRSWRATLLWFRRSGLFVGFGMLVCWITLNAMAGPGTIVIDQVEAEGPQFSDPSTLDIETTVDRKRVCPSQTQRWVWRKLNSAGLPWHEGDGKVREQTIPISSTVMPFLSDTDDVLLTLPVPKIPDPEHGGWMFRSVTLEHCPFLPTQLGSLFGTRMFRSKDVPVNFVGEPHEVSGR